MMRSWRVLLTVMAVACIGTMGLLMGAAQAADSYPSRPIQIIVPFPPGGVADLVGRPFATALEKLLNQPVVIVNKTGAGGAVGHQAQAVAKPDGYTLMVALSSISFMPEVDSMFGRPLAYKLSDFAPIALLSSDPTIMVVKASSPWKTLADYVADAKKRPGEIKYSSSGVYGTLHVATEMFAYDAGIKLRHIPTGGGGPALNALLGGHVDSTAAGPNVCIPQIKAGAIRALASWGDKRLGSLPDVPTFKELGYKNTEFYIWSGFFAPAATPQPILKVLREATAKAVQTPEFKGAMEKMVTPIAYLDAPEFKKFWDNDAARSFKAIRNIGKVQ